MHAGVEYDFEFTRIVQSYGQDDYIVYQLKRNLDPIGILALLVGLHDRKSRDNSVSVRDDLAIRGLLLSFVIISLGVV